MEHEMEEEHKLRDAKYAYASVRYTGINLVKKIHNSISTLFT